MYDPEAIRASTYSEMLRLCQMPEWKEWAWREVQRMDEDDLFAGIKAHVLKEMKNGAIK